MKKLLLIGTLCLVGISGCNSLFSTTIPSVAETSTSLIVSPNDQRSYQTLTLNNEIEVILVSDPKVEKSAASLSVGIGMLQDPAAHQGMAHYLEHMLFLGTERYPGTKSYSEFMTKNGGAHNAYTWLDITNYMFKVNNAAYDEALDRFSDFFKAPKLYPEYSEKEKNAVNAEWSISREQDSSGQFQLARKMMGNHPANRFLIGNLETLVDKPGSNLHQATVNFYNKYYSSNLMKVAMISNLPLKEMESLALKYFSNIKNKHIEKPNVSEKVNFKHAGGKRVYYQSHKDVQQIVLDFTIQNNQSNFSHKPNYFVTYLLGSEMPGSPARLLQEKGWIYSLYTSASPAIYGNYGTLSVDINLTNDGRKHRETIVALVMQYIELIQQKGINDKYFNEIKTALNNRFRFLEKGDEFDYVSTLADKMQKFPLKNVINAPYYYEKFDATAIKEVLNQLTPKTLKVWFISKKEKTNNQLHFFDGKYRIEELTKAEVDNWKKPLDWGLKPPAINRLLPKNFTIKQTVNKPSPELVHDKNGIKIWQLASKQFSHQPKGIIEVYINSTLSKQNIKSDVLLSVWSDLFMLQQSELIAEADIAGMNLSLNPEKGLILSITGFTDKQGELLSKALRRMQVNINKQNFSQAIDRLVKNIINESRKTPVGQAYNTYSDLVRNGAWDKQKIIQIAKELTKKDLQNFIKQLWKQNQIRVFTFGNYDLNDIQEVASILEKQLPSDHQSTNYIRDKFWKPTSNQLFVIKKDLEVDDVAVIDLHVHPEPSVKQQARAKVLQGHFQTIAFDTLRTEEQLAYTVGVIAPSIDKYTGLGLYIQTPVKGPMDIQARFDELKREYKMELNKLSEDTFNKLKTSVLVTLKEKPKNLSDEVYPFIAEWYRENFNFDTKAKLIAEIEKVSLNDIKTFYSETMNNSSAPRLNIQMRGKKFVNQPFTKFRNQTEVNSLSEFYKTINYQ